MVVAPECISTAQVCLGCAAVKPLVRGPAALRWWARVLATSSQQRGTREPGAQTARAGARAHRRLGGAHGQDLWRASTPRRGDSAQLVRLAGATRNRVAADRA